MRGRGSSINGFSVDYEALGSAAKKITSTVADGTLEKQCIAYGTNYGHDALSAAVITFTDAVDLGVEQFAAKTKDLAVGLTEQVENYRAVDVRVQNLFENPDALSSQSPLTPLSPLALNQLLPGLKPAFPVLANAFPAGNA
ncbi:hypothetical protein [Pengzhenrongella sp.]|jgi:hypothetical protein|uniref:hypothetical protein n=1 Tax=Pengzhenrongella sp. TaxID=2888820 RepID=UPI002F93776C